MPAICMYRGRTNAVANTAVLSPVLCRMVPSGFVLPPGYTSPPGSFKFQTLRNDGMLIKEIFFSPMIPLSDIIEGAEGAAPDDNEALFLIIAECDTAVATVKVVDSTSGNDIELTTLTVTPKAPTVEVVYPNGGESLSEGTIDIQWLGEDLNEDRLAYTVEFLPDGGNAWKTLAIDYPFTSLTVDLSILGKTNIGLICVRVSDGFLAGEDTSDGTFITPNSPALVQISVPVNGGLFVSVQPIFFQASTFDVEDGDLDAAIEWTSDIDGFLEIGELDRLASQLSEGDHLITASVTDTSGASADDSVLITVSCLSQPLNQPPVASCRDVTALAVFGCQADASIDDGTSFDPDDANPTIAQTPAGPYDLGDTQVTLSVTNLDGLVAECLAIVTVVDDEALDAANIKCGGPDTISPCNTPVLYRPIYQISGQTALTKANGCPVFCPAADSVAALSCKACNPAGKVVDRDCVVNIDSTSTFTIEESGGNAAHVSFMTTFKDVNGDVISDVCTVCVDRPEQGCNRGGNAGGGKTNGQCVGSFSCGEWSIKDVFTCPDT